MPPPSSATVSRVTFQGSRQLLDNSCVRIASAQELMSQARQSMARQRYCKIVCAWCQQTIRWQRAEEAARGQTSHSICFACFRVVLRELAPRSPLSSRSSQLA